MTLLSNKRNDTYDIVKGIAIILMVIGHSGCPHYLKNYIYLFHMPIFYFVSGYFFNEKYLNNKLDFIKRKLNQLYRPFVVYGLIFLFLSPLLYKANIIDNVYSAQEIKERTITIIIFRSVEKLAVSFWFLRSLFTVSILFLFIRFITSKFKKWKDASTILIVLFLFIIGNILAIRGIKLPSQFQREFIVLFFYALGFYFKKSGFPIICNKLLFSFLFILLAILAIYTRVDLVGSYFNNFFLFFIGSILGIYFLLIFSKYLLNTKLSCILIYCGKHTISILALHFISFKIVSLLIVNYENLPIKRLSDIPVISLDNTRLYYWIFYTIIGVTIPLLVNYIFSNIKNQINAHLIHRNS